MQNTSKVQQGQSFIDMVLQTTGSLDALVEMAVINNRSITDDLIINSEVKSEAINNTLVVNSLLNNRPATGYQIARLVDVELPSGIDYWAIEIDFEIN